MIYLLISEIVALATKASSKSKIDGAYIDALYELSIDDLIFLKDSYREERV